MRDRPISTVLCIALLGGSGFVSGQEAGDVAFRRGDADANGVLELTDAVFTLGFLFLGTETPSCLDALDADDGGSINIADSTGVLNYLFLGGPPPPFRDCGNDPTDDLLGCVAHESCDTGPGLELHLETGGGFTGQGAGDFHLLNGVLRLSNPFGDPEECSVELAAEQVGRLLEAADSVDWDVVQPTYVRPENPFCCCDQIGSELRVSLAVGERDIRVTTEWCTESLSAGLLPQDLIDLVQVMSTVAGEVSETCLPVDR